MVLFVEKTVHGDNRADRPAHDGDLRRERPLWNPRAYRSYPATGLWTHRGEQSDQEETVRACCLSALTFNVLKIDILVAFLQQKVRQHAPTTEGTNGM